jgi:hypothetical protein
MNSLSKNIFKNVKTPKKNGMCTFKFFMFPHKVSAKKIVFVASAKKKIIFDAPIL